jgi:hypothetical protein
MHQAGSRLPQDITNTSTRLPDSQSTIKFKLSKYLIWHDNLVKAWATKESWFDSREK